MAGPNPLAGLQLSGAQQRQLLKLASMPMHPPDVVKRFPSMAKYDEDMKTFLKNLTFSLQNSG